MGNFGSRNRGNRGSQSGLQSSNADSSVSNNRNRTSQSNFQSLHSHKKLAPVDLDESEIRDFECPICFINYTALNTLICCKQKICTVCYKQLNCSEDSLCPYCNRKSFAAEYIEASQPPRLRAQSAADKENNTSTPAKTSTPGSNNSSVKNRSESLDSSLPLSSKSDREALEAQIRNQRYQLMEEEDFTSIFSTPNRYSPNRRRTSGQNRSYSVGGTTFGSNAPSHERRLHQRRRFQSQQYSPNNDIFSENRGERYLTSIQTLLEGRDIDHVTSLEQLEELMLMEAIRQSVADSQSNSSSNNGQASSRQDIDASSPATQNEYGKASATNSSTNYSSMLTNETVAEDQAAMKTEQSASMSEQHNISDTNEVENDDQDLLYAKQLSLMHYDTSTSQEEAQLKQDNVNIFDSLVLSSGKQEEANEIGKVSADFELNSEQPKQINHRVVTPQQLLDEIELALNTPPISPHKKKET